jgi:hypothetical protein
VGRLVVVTHLVRRAAWAQQPAAAQPAAWAAREGPRLAELAALHEEAAVAAAHAGVAAAARPGARHEAGVAVAVPPDEGVEAEVPPQEALGAVEQQRAAEQQAVAQPSGAAPSAAAWAFHRDRFQPVARLARQPLAYSHSVRARVGPRFAQR